VTEALVIFVLIALIVMWVVSRVAGFLNMKVSGKTFFVVLIGLVIMVLYFYGSSLQGS
jgi:hypothetical protein